VLAEQRLDARALHAFASAMDEADLRVPLVGGSFEVVLDDVEHIARLETVQIDGVLDLENGDGSGIVVLRQEPDGTTFGVGSSGCISE
jgi:hypothetical protein